MALICHGHWYAMRGNCGIKYSTHAIDNLHSGRARAAVPPACCAHSVNNAACICALNPFGCIFCLRAMLCRFIGVLGHDLRRSIVMSCPGIQEGPKAWRALSLQYPSPKAWTCCLCARSTVHPCRLGQLCSQLTDGKVHALGAVGLEPTSRCSMSWNCLWVCLGDSMSGRCICDEACT